MKKLKIKQKQNRRGFTLVELVITIAIVIVLSVISVPIYRGYVDKAKFAEGYALAGTILSAQKAYFSEYGNWYRPEEYEYTNYDAFLGVDTRGNKYFTCFTPNKNTDGGNADVKGRFHAYVPFPSELITGTKKQFRLVRYSNKQWEVTDDPLPDNTNVDIR